MKGIKLYAQIEKVDQQDDGTIMVYGYASSEVQDSQGETVTAKAMKAALPDYMKFANIREMHQPSAVGKAKEAEVQEDGRTWIGAHVVDPTAVLKVQTGVYSGFSIGGTAKDRDKLDKSVITEIRLSEISLVDRPANPEAVVTVWKMDDAGDAKPEPEQAVDQLADLLTKGDIAPDVLVQLARDHIAKATAPEPSNEEKKPEPEPVVEKAEPEAEVKKGMYTLSRFGDILGSIGDLCQSTQWEAEYERDSSPLPAQLREWIAAGVVIYRSMAEEETAELLASLQAQVSAAVSMADKPGDVAKAGAKYSKVTKDALSGIHKMIQGCDKALCDMGYDKAEMADAPADVTKADAPEPATDAVAKLNDTVASLGEQLRKAMDRIADIEKQPAAPKGALKVIEKADDLPSGSMSGGVTPVVKSDGVIDDVATEIKKARSQGPSFAVRP